MYSRHERYREEVIAAFKRRQAEKAERKEFSYTTDKDYEASKCGACGVYYVKELEDCRGCNGK